MTRRTGELRATDRPVAGMATRARPDRFARLAEPRPRGANLRGVT